MAMDDDVDVVKFVSKNILYIMYFTCIYISYHIYTYTHIYILCAWLGFETIDIM
jgi:hypothetical protein